MSEPINQQLNPSQAPDQASGAGQTPRRPSVAMPWVTYTILAITVLIFLGQYATESTLGTDWLAAFGDKDNAAIMAGQYWRLVTPIFLHASILHIGFNMYFLFAIGPTLERFYGRIRFLLLYFLSGIAGNVVSFYLSPYPSVGASTALFGIVAAQAVFIFRNREFFGKQARGILVNTLLIVGVNLVLGLSPGIDNWGHMGGLAGGLAFAWAAGPMLTVIWLPAGGYTMSDRSSKQLAWITSGVELAVLALLVLARTFKI
jgi:rhomboid protease GluP